MTPGHRGWPADLRTAECDGAEFGHLAMPLGGLTVVGGVGTYDAFVDETAVPTRSAGAGIEFPGGIRLVDGQTLILAAR